MGWLARKIRLCCISPGLRLKKEKRPAAYQHREVSSWEILDAQMALENWFRNNGLK